MYQGAPLIGSERLTQRMPAPPEQIASMALELSMQVRVRSQWHEPTRVQAQRMLSFLGLLFVINSPLLLAVSVEAAQLVS